MKDKQKVKNFKDTSEIIENYTIKNLIIINPSSPCNKTFQWGCLQASELVVFCTSMKKPKEKSHPPWEELPFFFFLRLKYVL